MNKIKHKKEKFLKMELEIFQEQIEVFKQSNLFSDRKSYKSPQIYHFLKVFSRIQVYFLNNRNTDKLPLLLDPSGHFEARKHFKSFSALKNIR